MYYTATDSILLKLMIDWETPLRTINLQPEAITPLVEHSFMCANLGTVSWLMGKKKNLLQNYFFIFFNWTVAQGNWQ